jgi:predicted RND superfamily exporter protein
MKKILFYLFSILVFASCSTSKKYSYYFDHYDYNSGRKSAIHAEVATTPEIAQSSPLLIEKEQVEAEVNEKSTPATGLGQKEKAMAQAKEAFAKKYAALSKAEQKEVKKELKEELKKQIKAKKLGERDNAVKGTKAMDHDLKMALIFGVVGLVLTLFGAVSSVFWVLGVISIVIGVVFLVIWLSKQ